MTCALIFEVLHQVCASQSIAGIQWDVILWWFWCLCWCGCQQSILQIHLLTFLLTQAAPVATVDVVSHLLRTACDMQWMPGLCSGLRVWSKASSSIGSRCRHSWIACRSVSGSIKPCLLLVICLIKPMHSQQSLMRRQLELGFYTTAEKQGLHF